MEKEITFILEPDRGLVTLESSQVSNKIVGEIKESLGESAALNCGRPNLPRSLFDEGKEEVLSAQQMVGDEQDFVHLFRLYHYSTVDGPGRRSVVQFAGCSIRCLGCYVPETHLKSNGKLTLIKEIICEIDKKRGEHDGVTILGGEPFDQVDALERLVIEIKKKNYHLTIYSGYTLEDLLCRKCPKINRILLKTDLLIDGAYRRELAKNAGEYRGSSNQKLYLQPFLENYEQKTSN